jgi:hypothetical protein
LRATRCANADSNSDSDSNSNVNRKPNCHAYSQRHGYLYYPSDSDTYDQRNTNGYSYADFDSYTYSYRDTYFHSNGYSNAYIDSDAMHGKMFTYAKAASHPSAAAVGWPHRLKSP